MFFPHSCSFVTDLPSVNYDQKVLGLLIRARV